jgi:hypothetical protein
LHHKVFIFRRGIPRSQLPENRDEILLLLTTHVELLNEIEEFNGILQCQQASVMIIRRRVLYPPQWKCLDGPFSPRLLVNSLTLISVGKEQIRRQEVTLRRQREIQ